MDHLPMFADIEGKPVAVVGRGTTAARKTEMALRAGAHVRLFARNLGDHFRALDGHDRLVHYRHFPSRGDLAGCMLVFSAWDDPGINRAVRDLAKSVGAWVNVADAPELSDFIMPSVIDRHPLVIAVSTSGASPVLARMIRARLENSIPAAYGKLVEFVGGYRRRIGRSVRDPVARRRFWESLLEGSVAERVLEGRQAAATAEMNRALAAASSGIPYAPRGEVYLVGAGPGDPDLLTFRALRLMQRADVVLYDRLIGEGILNLVRRDAERIYVGKQPGSHVVSQEQIVATMMRLVREGKRVLRLKGGDPFMFGRGGEEIESLAAEGIPVQVVPGITAAAGCAAYAGIPLTHRDHAQACVFVTGHCRSGCADVDWNLLLRPRQTVVIFMGLGRLPELTKQFIGLGVDPNLPTAVVDHGTLADQRVVTGTIATIAELAGRAELRGPAAIIIGTVVTLREKLAQPHVVGTEQAWVAAATSACEDIAA
jgi:uroporphyrin-III C-methyltransferase/precorrin-2 dehydrogenase/sirohydrochlorin ferrochelatase